MNSQAFKDLVRSRFGALSDETIVRIDAFRELVLRENEQQNLTRLTSEDDFLYGHLADCWELVASGFVDHPAMDIGSGVGVPGLLCSLISPMSWVLAESEQKKAQFLARAAKELGVDQVVRVFSGRAEDFLKTETVKSVIARAVGPVDRIYGWIRACSTWNNLVLLKGPGWESEWQAFKKTKRGRELRVAQIHTYRARPDHGNRLLIRIERVASSRIARQTVPRGTI